MKGNEISASVLQELAQYTEILKREDKRVEIRAALAQIDRNSAGGIDEDEFKAVLKLLTGTEPNKKEVRTLMQQHSSQTSASGGAGDSSVQKSAMSLENLLLAKCSSSPSKKAACPPWEALVQVRHAMLGQQYPNQLAKAKSEYSAAEPSHGSERPAVSAMHRSQSQQISLKTDAPNIQVSNGSSSSATAQRISVAAAAPNVNVKLAMAMPPPPPLQISTSGHTQQQQQQSPVSSSSGSSDRGDGSAYAKLKADFKPPASPPPPLPLPQTVATSASSPDSKGAASRSVYSFSSSSGRGSQENVLTEQPAYPLKVQASSAVAPVDAIAAPARAAPSSPDRMSVYSSSSSFSQYIDSVDTPRQSTTSATTTSAAAPSQLPAAQRVSIDDLEKKKSTPQHSVANSVISESPRWRDEDIFTDDEEDDAASTGHGDDGTDRDEVHVNELDEDPISKAGSSSNEFHSTGSVSSSSKTSHSSGLSKSHAVFQQQQHRRIDSGTFASEIVELSDGEDGPAPPLVSTATERVGQFSVSSRTDKDLSSLIYRADEITESGAAARRQLALGPIDDYHHHSVEPQSNNDDPVNDDDDKEERVDSIVSDVVKDGKPRSVAKVIHTEFKRGLLLKDFPHEISFRNLIALVLSHNGLSNLALFNEVLSPTILC